MPPGVTDRIIFVSTTPALALGLDLVLTNFAAVCADDSSIVDLLTGEDIPVFCLARQLGQSPLSGTARSRNSNEILAQPEVQQFIHRLDPAAVVVFKNSAGIQQICQEQGWRLLASEALIARKYENKLFFPQVLEELGLAHPPLLVSPVKALTLEGIRQALGLPAVLQYAKGFSGRETYFIRTEAELAAAKAGNENRNAKCTAYIPGLTITVNACVTPFGILTSDPFVQITGVPELTPYRLGSCGQDWAFQPVSDSMVERIREAAERIGGYLGARGYRGIFGLDFVVDESEADLYVIETNPRLVASIPVFTDLQLAAGELPLLLWHLQAFGWQAGPQEYRLPEVQFNPESFQAAALGLRGPRPGGQLILHNTEGFDQVISGSLSAGVYALAGEDLRPIRPGVHLLDKPGHGEFLVLPGGQGQVIHAGIECARVQFPHSVLVGKDLLSETARRAITAVYQALNLTRVI
jgi:hypothetical protein